MTIARQKLAHLTLQQLKEMMDSDGNLDLVHPPTLNHSLKMNTRELVKVLRLCPVSNMFGEPRSSFIGISRDEARNRVLAFSKAQIPLECPLSEI